MIRRADWAWLLGINAAAAIVIEAMFRAQPAEAPLLAILAGAWPVFIVPTTISGLYLVVVPRLAPTLLHRLGAPARWLAMVATLAAIAVAGTALALAVLRLTGHVGGWDAIGAQFQQKMKVAILVTVALGIYTTINQALRAKLDQTTLALRTKERDEADARRIASEAQLAALESRVNPHFLFNTLNAIAELTREDAARAERMTTQLASLMRTSLEGRAVPLVPLEQEAQSIRDYLEIEQARFGGRLRYDIRIAPDAACALVPRLALQTIVENAVKYAVSPRRDGASLSIGARRQGDRVRVEVVDDGPGFDEGARPDGHGLALVRDRLRLLHGDAAALSVSSRPGHTTVAIVVPASAPDA
jgi:signal transduction histidine kinase